MGKIQKPKFICKRETRAREDKLDEHSFWINADDFDEWFDKNIAPLNQKIDELEHATAN